MGRLPEGFAESKIRSKGKRRIASASGTVLLRIGLTVRQLAQMMNGPAALSAELPIENDLDHFGTSDAMLTNQLCHRGSS
jgi:hypothetical protein